jgi:autotransporter-associated beta strand protein
VRSSFGGGGSRRSRLAIASAIAGVAAALLDPKPASAQLTGVTGAHDPSTLSLVSGKYYYYTTGQGIVSRSSTDMTSWSAGPAIFNTPPAWTTQAVPGFTGNFWAPDVAFHNNQYYLYYSVSTFGSNVSAIGLATSPTLDPSAANYAWTDQGMVVQSVASSNFNTIDPSILQDTTTGRMWMSYGSFWNGIFVRELDPTTGKPLSGSTAVNVADASQIEASYLMQHGGFYYLFVNWGQCCSGIDSTYNIRVGRSTSPTGPFLDKNGVNLLSGGGSLFLDDDGTMTGPGQFAYFNQNGTDYFSYHYYSGDANGTPTYGLRKLYWTTDNWPSYAAVNPNWTGTTSTSWSLASNWTADGVPNGVGNVANFVTVSSGRYTVAVDGGGKTVSTINLNSPSASYTIGDNAGSTITLDAQTGDVAATINVLAGSGSTIAAPISAIDPLAVNVTTANCSLSMTGAVSAPSFTKYGRGTLTLGGVNSYSGSVLLHAGALNVSSAGSVTPSQIISVAPTGGDIATMSVSGGSVNANAATVPSLSVGPANSAVGSVRVNSGSLSTTSELWLSSTAGGYGAMTINAGNVSVGSWLALARGGGTGILNVNGGSLSVSTNNLTIGSIAGGSNQNAVATLTGGTTTVTNGGVYVGEITSGVLNVSGSAALTASGALGVKLANTGSATGIVNLRGGTITTPIVQKGTGTNGTVNFNGGTLRASTSTTSFMTGLSAAYVYTGGATFDTAANNVTIAQPLLAPSGSGVTSIALTANGTGYIDTPLVSIAGGTLAAGGVRATAIANLNYTTGQVFGITITNPGNYTSTANLTVSFAGGGGTAPTVATIGTAANTSGGLTKLGTGTLTLGGVNTYTGTTTVNAGSLLIATAGSLATGANVTVNSGATLSFAGNPSSTAAQTRMLGTLNVPAGNVTLGASTTATEPLTLQASAMMLGGAIDVNNNILIAPGQPSDALGLITNHNVTTSNTHGLVLGYGSTGGGSNFEIRATLLGDSDLDGQVNVADLANLAGNFGVTTGATWLNGDFDYNSNVNVADLADLAGNFGNSLSSIGAAAASTAAAAVPVPEPLSPAWLAAVAFGVVGTHNKRRNRFNLLRGT